MALLAEFLNTLFTNSGIDVQDEKLASVIKQVANVNVPEELTNSFNNNYLTRKQAISGDLALKAEFAKVFENDDNLRKTFYAQFRNGDEAYLSDIAKEYGIEIDPSAKDYKSKLKNALSKLATAEKSDNKKDIEKYTAQINDLSQKLSQAQSDMEAKIKETVTQKEMEFNADLIESFYDRELSNHKLIDSPTGDAKLIKMVALQTIKDALSKKGLDIVRTADKRFAVRQKTSPDLAYFESGKEVAPENLIKSLLVESKLIAQQKEQSTTDNNRKPEYVPFGAEGESEFARARRQLAERDSRQQKPTE